MSHRVATLASIAHNPMDFIMDQATLDLPVQPADSSIDRTGFQIGWDHAHHGLVPLPGLLLAGTSVGQGWRAARAVYSHRTLACNRHTRSWLALRIRAWREGVDFELHQVTPAYLAQIHVERCPILRTGLGGACGEPHAALIDRINPRCGYAAGNLVVTSQRAAAAREHMDVQQTLRRAHRAQASGEVLDGLDGAAWLRLAVLRSFGTPLPFVEAARLPLAVLPPNLVGVVNAAQGLQALLTLQFGTPGWSARTRAIAELLPQHTLRQDYNLFIGAIAPRVLEAGAAGSALRQVLEDAWLGDRVQRRWQHFVLSLGEAGTGALLERASEQGLASAPTLKLGQARAAECPALTDGRHVQDRPSAAAPGARPVPASSWTGRIQAARTRELAC
ncbi:MAG TPA: hypothetical protein VK570_03650 [Rubrivivax sp.]|nr:hypothetical protein [Rubrivivax sp.]